jgi:hypothetical protein
MSAYIQSDIPEEEEELMPEVFIFLCYIFSQLLYIIFLYKESKNGAGVSAPPRIPPLGELEQAQLYSCLDLLRDRMGDALSEQAGINAILAANFDAEKALDQLLRNSVPVSLKKVSKPTIREKTVPAIQGINIMIHKIVKSYAVLNNSKLYHLKTNFP